jgi:hypothetical protein
MTEDDVKKVDEFVAKFSFDVKDKNNVVLRGGPQGDVNLAMGETYHCRIFNKRSNASLDFGVFLTNIEFRRKTFFSITVDIYLNDNLYRPNVYFYNLAIIQDRAPRFELNKDTISNNFDFWTTLQPAELLQHHSDVEFFRIAVSKAHGELSKDCRANIRNVRKTEKPLFAKLDNVKKGLPPSIRMQYKDGKVVVYGVKKNRPLRRLLEIGVNDRIESVFSEQDVVPFTVVAMDAEKMTVRGAVKSGGVEGLHDVFYYKYDQPFWKNLARADGLRSPEDSVPAFLMSSGGGRRSRRRHASKKRRSSAVWR